MAGAGAWRMECGLTVPSSPGTGQGREGEQACRGRATRVQRLPDQGSWTEVEEVARESLVGRNYESKTGTRGTPCAPKGSPRDGEGSVLSSASGSELAWEAGWHLSRGQGPLCPTVLVLVTVYNQT